MEYTWNELPDQVKARMLIEQRKQSGRMNPKIFKEDIYSDKQCGGFDWDSSEQGKEFWVDVIEYKRLDVFYEKYPRKLVRRQDVEPDTWYVIKGFNEQHKMDAIIWSNPRDDGHYVGMNHAGDITTKYNSTWKEGRRATPSEIHKVTQLLNETNVELPSTIEEIEI